MARFSDTVRDQNDAALAGVSVYVTAGGVLVALTDDLGAPLTNPITTDTFGGFTFNVADGAYDLSFRRDGRMIYQVKNVLIGTSAIPSGAVLTVVASRSALALAPTVVGQIVQLIEAGREGQFIARAGARPSDPLQGLYAPGPAGFYFERLWDGTHGRPEWFGAIPASKASAASNLAALHACRDLCPITQLSPGFFYVDNTVLWNRSSRQMVGAGRSADGASATTLCLTGPNVVTATILEVGGRTEGSTARWVHVAQFDIARDLSVYQPRETPTGDLIDGTKGLLYSYCSNSVVEYLRCFDSPVGVHVIATARCFLQSVNVSASNIPAGRKFCGFLIGGYAAHYGFVGANGSLSVLDCDSFEPGPSTSPIYLKLFGAFADTWIKDFECAGANGILIDGADGLGSIINTAGCHQDVLIEHPIIDGVLNKAFEIKNVSSWGVIGIIDPYIACGVGGTALAVHDCDKGLKFSVDGDGQFLGSDGAGGIDISGIDGAFVGGGIKLRDFQTYVQLANSVGSRIKPTCYARGAIATNAINLVNVDRCIVEPSITGSPSKITNAVSMDAACGYNKVDGSAIDPGCFATVDAAYKVRFAGADARSGFGTNVLSGVTG